MTRLFNAICVGNVVTTLNVPPEIIAGCKILSQGIGPSEGVVIISEDGPVYVAKTTPDVDTIIGQLTGDFTQCATALTAIQASLVANDSGASSAAPVAAAVAALTSSVVLLTALKAVLK